MKLDFNKRYTTIAVYAFLVLAAATLFQWLTNHYSSVSGAAGLVVGLLKPFIYAFGIAYILNPMLKFFETKWVEVCLGRHASEKVKRGIALLLTYLFSAGVIAIFVMIVIPQLVSSVSGLVYEMTNYVNSTDKWLPQLLALFPDVDFMSTITNTLQQYANTIINTTISMLKQALPLLLSLSTNFASGLLKVVVGIIISIYMLMDKERFCAGIKKICYASLSAKKVDWLLELSSDANRTFGGFINGKLLDSLIIGILCFFGMTALKMPSVMLVSVIVGVTNVIPYFGPFIGAIPSFFIILIDAPIKSLWFLVFILILQQFDGNILGPKILGDSTGLSAFWVIFSIMLFGGLYGFLGMFLGVPVFSVIFMLLRRLVDAKLGARSMPLEIEAYCAPEAPILRPSAAKAARDAREEQEEKMEHRRAHTVKPLKRGEENEPKS